MCEQEKQKQPTLNRNEAETLLDADVFNQIILAIVREDIPTLETVISKNNIPTTIKPGDYFVNQFPLNFIALFLRELITNWNTELPSFPIKLTDERFFEIATIFLSETFESLDFSSPNSCDFEDVMKNLKQNNFLNRKKPNPNKDGFKLVNLMQKFPAQIASLIQMLDVIGVYGNESVFQSYMQMYGKGGKNSKYRPSNFWNKKELWKVEENAPTYLQWFIDDNKEINN